MIGGCSLVVNIALDQVHRSLESRFLIRQRLLRLGLGVAERQLRSARARAPQFRRSSCTCISDRAPVKDEFWPVSNGILPCRECTRGVGMRTKCLCGPPEMHLSLALSPNLNSLLKIQRAREGGREGERERRERERGGREGERERREREEGGREGERERGGRERREKGLPHLFSSNSSCISSLANSSSWNSSSILSTSPQ